MRPLNKCRRQRRYGDFIVGQVDDYNDDDNVNIVPAVGILQTPVVDVKSPVELKSSSSLVTVTEADCKTSQSAECDDCLSDWNVCNQKNVIFSNERLNAQLKYLV